MREWLWPAATAFLALLLAVTWLRLRGKENAARRDGRHAGRDKRVERTYSKTTHERSRDDTGPKKSRRESKRAPESSRPRRDDASVRPSAADLPKLEFEEDDEVDPTRIGAAAAAQRPRLSPPTKRIVYDEDAADEEPTQQLALILVTAQAQTDRGLRRKRNEDSILALPEYGVFVVADGMGGYQGGEIASALAVKTIEQAFRTSHFQGDPHEGIPARASELARAIQMANDSILDRAQEDPALSGMGTTICAVRFAAQKQRLYVGHVGDSRLYRVRGSVLRRMTSDHTMKDLGVTGPQGAHLSRAVGVWPTVPIDVVLGKPRPGDLYVLCSDGLTKMVKDDEIGRIVNAANTPSAIVDNLIETANANGGKDNVSVIVIQVLSPTGAGGSPRPAAGR